MAQQEGVLFFRLIVIKDDKIRPKEIHKSWTSLCRASKCTSIVWKISATEASMIKLLRSVLWWLSRCLTQQTTLSSSGISQTPSTSAQRSNCRRWNIQSIIGEAKMGEFPDILFQLELEQAKTEDCTIEYSTGTFTCLAAVFKMRRNPGTKLLLDNNLTF